MAIIIPFPRERCRPAQPTPPGHKGKIIPFPRPAAAPAPVETPKAGMLRRERTPRTGKNVLIAKVKIAQKQLGMPDDVYRTMLWINFGVSSCTELDEQGLVRLVRHFRSKGWQDKPSMKKDRHGKPRCLKTGNHPGARVMARIGALLAELGNLRGDYVPWDYAAGILKKHTGLDHLEQATTQELNGVMVALERTLNSERRRI